MLQIVRFAMLLSILIYGFLVKQLPSQHAKPNPIIYLVIVVVSVSIILTCPLLSCTRSYDSLRLRVCG